MPIVILWHVSRRAVHDWWNETRLRMAASLAYYTALSLAPLVLLLVGVIGLVLDRQQVGAQISAQLEGLIGPAGRELVSSILAAASPQGGTVATIIGLATLLIGATAVFGEIQATLNLLWEVRPAPTNGVWAGIGAGLRDRLCSLTLVLALAFLLLVSLVLSAALAGAAALVQGPEPALVSRLLKLAVSLLVLTFVFALLSMSVPDAEIGWREVGLGGGITAVLFTLGKTAIGLYLGQASVGSAYGAAGSLVVLLVWVYYSALIMFFGAEFTHVWAARHGEVTPQPHAISGTAPQTKSAAATDSLEGCTAPSTRGDGMDQGTVADILAQTPHQPMRRTLPGTHGPAMRCDGRIAVGMTNVLLLVERLEPLGHEVRERPFACLRTAGGPVRHGEPH